MTRPPVPQAVEPLIQRLALQPHPEGGWFRETHRSPIILARHALPEGYAGDCSAFTSILFLLPTGQRSALHRIQSEELWLHQMGDDLRLEVADVAARHGQVGVPELRLYHVERHALASELGGVRMAEAVRVDALLDSCAPPEALHEVPHVGR